jgi:acyl-CoA thioesterase-1
LFIMKEIALERGRYGYGAGAMVLQAMLLGGCDKAPSAPVMAGAPDATSAAQDQPASSARVAGKERLVLAFGDSLYAGYGLARGQSLPDALQRRLRAVGINARFVNAGVSGDTSAAGRRRLAFSLNNLPRKPDLVLLGLGGNDVLRQISPAETRANMVAMLDELAERDIPVMLTGMQAPPNLGPDYVKPFNAIWPELAARYKAGLYPFILDGVIGNASLMQPDRVHPKAAGVDRIADKIAPLVAKQLQGPH